MENTSYGALATAIETVSAQSDFKLNYKPIDLVVNWERCSLTANFLSQIDIFGDPLDKDVLHALSTILNELIECSVRLSNNLHQLSQLTISQFPTHITVMSHNKTNQELASKLDIFFQRLFEDDPELLFLNVLNAPVDTLTTIQLGLLMIVRDYNPKIGANIMKSKDDSDNYDIIVRMDIQIKPTH